MEKGTNNWLSKPNVKYGTLFALTPENLKICGLGQETKKGMGSLSEPSEPKEKWIGRMGAGDGGAVLLSGWEGGLGR